MKNLFLSLFLSSLATASYAQVSTHPEKVIAIQQAQIQELKTQLEAISQKLDETRNATGAAQATANQAVSKADSAQSSANTGINKADSAQGTANAAVNLANGAQGTANAAAGKRCYLASNGHGSTWGQCKFGGSYGGGITIEKPVAGINEDNNWKQATYTWLCCT